MNKLILLLLAVFLFTQVDAKNSLRYDLGEDDRGEISGSWNVIYQDDNGELIEKGDFNAEVKYYQGNQYWLSVEYKQYFHNSTRLTHDQGEFGFDSFEDSGRFVHYGELEEGQTLTKEEIKPIIIKRLKIRSQ